MENYVEVDRAANEHRVIEFGDNKMNIKKASGPYGFWQLSLEKGRLPDSLMGMYTSPSQAAEAAKGYIAEKLKSKTV